MSSTIALTAAEQQVTNYCAALPQNELADHAEAMECLDCEDYLQLGIDAYRWMTRADEGIRAAIYSGEMEYNEEFDQALARLYRLWLAPCERARHWANLQQERGFSVENLSKFEECCREVEAIVRHLDGNQQVNEAMVALRDVAVAEHREGKTVEFRWDAEPSDE